MIRKAKRDVYAEVTYSLVSLLESGVSPWRRPYDEAHGSDMPHNAVTGRHYSGINLVTTWAASMRHGYSSDAWLTFKQAKDHGGKVRKNERSIPIVFYKNRLIRDTDTGEEKCIPLMRYYSAFNVDQCDGLQGLTEREPLPEIEPGEVFEYLQRTGAKIVLGGNRAFYQPSADVIHVPKRNQFKTQSGFNGTVSHECVHWTGHASRLDRLGGAKRFGDDAYAFEELVAEIGASYLCAMLGQPYELEQHASYLDSWLRNFKSDTRFVFRAASKASKAVDLILELAGEEKAETETQADAA